MKQYIVAGVTVITLSSASLGYAAPKLYSELGVRGVNQETKDYTNEVYRALFGAKGKYDVGAIKALYNLEVDFASTANEQNGGGDITVREAVLVLPTPVGAFIGGRATSGTYRDLYSGVDLFETNGFEGANRLYGQGKFASRVAAYASPALAGFQLKGAFATTSDSNDKDLDLISARLVYNNAGLRVGVAHTAVDASALPTSKDYVRNALGINYEASQFRVGFTAEENLDHPAGNSTVFGGAVGYTLNDVQLGLGYQVRDNEVSEDDRLLAYQAKYLMNEQLSLWGEVGDYEQNEKDNASVGVSFKF